MTYRNDPWKDFRYKLDLFESNIKHLKFQGAFDTPQPDFLPARIYLLRHWAEQHFRRPNIFHTLARFSWASSWS